jgi:hypothetical protein
MAVGLAFNRAADADIFQTFVAGHAAFVALLDWDGSQII